MNIKKGQLVSWKIPNGNNCGLVVGTFVWTLFEEKEQQGAYVLSFGNVYKIYDISELKVIKDMRGLYNV